ncbi:AAA family ATPase [Aeromonas veronii]
MSSLKKITARNYKGFENIEFEIKPLTVLLGANSGGKSSILNLILMLAQSIESNDEMLTPLRINGQYVGLGDAHNIIRNKDDRNILGLSIELHQESTTSNYIKLDFTKEDLFYFTANLFKRRMKEIDAGDYLIKDYDVHSANYKPDNKTLSESITNLMRVYRTNYRTYSEKIRETTNFDKFFIDAKYQRVTDFLELFDQFDGAEIYPSEFKYNLRLEKDQKKKILLSSAKIINFDGKVIFSISERASGNGYEITSEILNNQILSKINKKLSDLISFDSLLLKPRNSLPERLWSGYFIITEDPAASFIAYLIIQCTNRLRNSLYGTVSHVSPLRAHPQRYYLLDKTIVRTQLDTASGTELAEILKKRTDILYKINKLLFPFELKIKIDNINDVIHRITVIQDNVSLELTDVGFGISQVLPILVQAYITPNNSITIIEQPEIHLHPKMQAWLTDALINIALDESKKLIIETHSEAIIRRIRRRVVENESRLNPNNVAIYNIEKNAQCIASLNAIQIKENGDIIWPKGFLDVEIDDLRSIQEAKMKKAMMSRGE